MIFFAVPLLFFACTASSMDHNEALHAEPPLSERANPPLATDNWQDTIQELTRSENNSATWYKAVLVNGDYIVATDAQYGINVYKHVLLKCDFWHCVKQPKILYYILRDLYYEQQQGNAQ